MVQEPSRANKSILIFANLPDVVHECIYMHSLYIYVYAYIVNLKNIHSFWFWIVYIVHDSHKIDVIYIVHHHISYNVMLVVVVEVINLEKETHT